jgi:hypothetical protein
MSAYSPKRTPVDRVIRVVIGVVLLSLVWIGPQTAWGWVGLLPSPVGRQSSGTWLWNSAGRSTSTPPREHRWG